MTDAPKLLTEAEWRGLWRETDTPAPFFEWIAPYRERGLIAPEPVDPLEAEAFAIVQMHYPEMKRDYNGRRFLIALAALKRGMEMRAPLTREMVFDALYQAFQDSDARDMDELDFGPSCVTGAADRLTDALHAALTKEQS